MAPVPLGNYTGSETQEALWVLVACLLWAQETNASLLQVDALKLWN